MKKNSKRNSRKNRKFTRKNRGGSIMANIKNKTALSLSKLTGQLWSSKKFKKEKERFKEIKPDKMQKDTTYYIEHIDGCSLERGVFDEIYEEGTYRGAMFKNIKLLYKSSKPECRDFPATNTRPKYSEDGNKEIGRTGEIRFEDSYIFYE
jgi:hypothetical protein